MHCPFCRHSETQVKDSRTSDDGENIKRRRYCPACGLRFTTYEKVHLPEIIVIKKSGEKKTFDAQKLKKSINMAVRKRPVENSQVEQIVYQIVHQIAINNELEITSAKIGEFVLDALEKLDQVAFVRFASVYKNFKTPQDFQQFIKKIV
jgi:transcriptional repressor NrdR